MRRPRILSLLALAALALGGLAFAACGSGNSSNGPAAGSVGSAVAHTSIPQGAPVIDENNLQFKPGKLTVNAGEAVYFKNSETAIHDVVVDGGLKSPDMRKNAIYSYTFKLPGSYNITCSYHPQMHTTVTVK